MKNVLLLLMLCISVLSFGQQQVTNTKGKTVTATCICSTPFKNTIKWETGTRGGSYCWAKVSKGKNQGLYYKRYKPKTRPQLKPNK